MSRHLGFCLMIALVGLAPSGGIAAEERTFEGVLVDPSTYLQEGRHDVDSAELALDGGQSLAVLDTEAKALYLLLAEQAGEDPNELIYDHLDGSRLRFSGEVFERDGVRGIILKSVQPVSSEPVQADPGP